MSSHEDAYREALTKELREKERLLDQARQACQQLQKGIGSDATDQAIWNELSERQLYVPSRADPIGIAILRQSLDFENKQQLFESSLTDLHNLVESQRSFNNEMIVLVNLLGERLNEEGELRKELDLDAKVDSLRLKLDNLVRNHIAFDIASGDFTPHLAAEGIIELLDRLLRRDKTLSQNDFSPNYMNLFRLLDKAYLLEKNEKDDKILIELAEFK